MGNTLQDYRCKIGSFANCKSSKIKQTASQNFNRKSKCFKFLPGFILLFSLLCLFSSSSSTNSSLNSSHSNSKSCLPNSSSLKNHNFLARYIHGNIRRNGIKLCHWNKGPGFLSTKLNEVENIINGYHPHVLGISESNFHSNHAVEDVQIENYDVYFSKSLKNPQFNISRLAVYVHKDLIVKVREDLMNDTFNSVWLEVGLPRQKKILVCNIYRQWQFTKQGDDKSSATVNSQLARFVSFLDQWERAVASGREICVLGDFNLDFLHFGRNNLPANSQSARLRPLVAELFDRIIPHGFAQMVSVFTRSWPNQESSGLDHFWTNRPEKLSQVHATWAGGSDHKIIFATRYTRAQISKPRIIRKRSYKNFVPSQFLEAVRKISWWGVYSECFDCESAAKIMTDKLTDILDLMAPIRTFQVRTKYAPWLSQHTKDLIKERDQAQKKAAFSKDEDDWRRFKGLRNSVTNILRTEKKNWQANKINQFGNDTSSIWKNVKNWLGWSKGGPPTKIISEGNIFSRPKDVAKIMNNFFINKVRLLRNNLPPNPGNPLILVKKLMENRKCTFKLKCVHPDKIGEIIDNLKHSKSCGIDNIDSYIIKLAKSELVPVITHVVNLSISQPMFPSLWKTAKTIPLHKKNEKMYAENYRPVSLLPIYSKILERAVFCQIIDYMETNNLLHPSHHGFRGKHNTSTALLQMIDTWVEAFDKDDVTAVVMVDLSAAFDVVDHMILLQKLEIYGFEMKEILWMKSYLTERKQQVYVDGTLSDPLDLQAGVPQGSILGPLLYIIFTNDLPEVVHDHLTENNSYFNTHCQSCGSICSFADDSTYSKSGKDMNKLKDDIDDKFKEISNYMAKNKLVLNSDKTHLLVMTSSQMHKKHENFGIVLNTGQEIIEPVQHEKLLGAHISNDFKFNNHIRADKF